MTNIATKGMTFRLSGMMFQETSTGFNVEFREKSYNVRIPAYSADFLKGSWPEPSDPRTLAALKDRRPAGTPDDRFLALNCATEQRAIRYAALYCRYVHNVPESIFWSDKDKVIYFHIDLKVQSRTDRIPREKLVELVTVKLPKWIEEQDVYPLLAEDVVRLYEEHNKISYPGRETQDGGTIHLLKPVLYLDIENVLVMEPEKDRHRPEWRQAFPEGEPSPGATEFLQWAMKNFDCRWCSEKTTIGELYEYGAKRLARAISIDADILRNRFKNPKGCLAGRLTAGINFQLDSWAWVTNDLSPMDRAVIEERKAQKRVYDCDCSSNPGALIRVWHELKRDFSLVSDQASAT
jgi:hypothetical protein